MEPGLLQAHAQTLAPLAGANGLEFATPSGLSCAIASDRRAFSAALSAVADLWSRAEDADEQKAENPARVSEVERSRLLAALAQELPGALLAACWLFVAATRMPGRRRHPRDWLANLIQDLWLTVHGTRQQRLSQDAVWHLVQADAPAMAAALRQAVAPVGPQLRGRWPTSATASAVLQGLMNLDEVWSQAHLRLTVEWSTDRHRLRHEMVRLGGVLHWLRRQSALWQAIASDDCPPSLASASFLRTALDGWQRYLAAGRGPDVATAAIHEFGFVLQWADAGVPPPAAEEPDVYAERTVPALNSAQAQRLSRGRRRLLDGWAPAKSGGLRLAGIEVPAAKVLMELDELVHLL